MKYKNIFTAVLLVAGVQSSFAAAYSVSNDQGLDSHAIVDNTGTALTNTSGSAALGYFSGGDADVSTATGASSLLDSWQQFGAASTFAAAQASPPFIDKGVVTVGSSGIPVGGFATKNIYMVVSNATTLAGGNQFFIYKFNETFSENEPGTGTKLTLGVNSGSVILGRDLGNPLVSVSTTLNSPQQSYGTVTIVPEPSSAALVGLGGIALIFRRRK